jgi:hypothetical protein
MAVDRMAVDAEDVARTAFLKTWEELATFVDMAEAARSKSLRDPVVAQDPASQLYVRWLSLFEPELAAAQRIAEAITVGARLPADDLRAARETAEEVLRVIVMGRTLANEQLRLDLPVLPGESRSYRMLRDDAKNVLMHGHSTPYGRRRR